MYVVYGMASSGNCHKIKLLLDLLSQPYEWRETDILAGESRTPEFLARNPNGRVPTLQLPDGEFLAESNAILCYLAEGTRYFAGDRLTRARTLQWLFFEQYSHEPYIAVARFICRFLPADHERRAELPRLRQRGGDALHVMSTALAKQPYFGGESASIADIALYAYTHRAGDAGFDLAQWPAVQQWIARCEREQCFTPMTA